MPETKLNKTRPSADRIDVSNQPVEVRNAKGSYQMKQIKTKLYFTVFAVMAFAIAGCSGGGGGSSSGGSSSVTGVVSAAPIANSAVTAYSLNSDGSIGTQLGTTTSDSSGSFTLSISPQSGPVSIVASGGSYSEEASGSTVSMGNAKIRLFLPSIAANQKVGVTPITEIAAQNVVAAISANGSTSLSGLIGSSNASIATPLFQESCRLSLKFQGARFES